MAAGEDWYGWHTPRLVGHLRSAAVRFDELPISPAGAAKRVLDAVTGRQNARAARDPVWAALEARRLAATDDEGTITITADYDIDDMRELDNIARRITPDPAWLPRVRRIADWELWRVALWVERRVQKSRLGWHEHETFWADRHLCRAVGELLLAYDQLGWTGNDEFASQEAWHEALTLNGNILATFGTPISGHRYPASPDLEEARGALHWAADHLHKLSD